MNATNSKYSSRTLSAALSFAKGFASYHGDRSSNGNPGNDVVFLDPLQFRDAVLLFCRTSRAPQVQRNSECMRYVHALAGPTVDQHGKTFTSQGVLPRTRCILTFLGNGFPGYVLSLATLHEASFDNLLQKVRYQEEQQQERLEALEERHRREEHEQWEQQQQQRQLLEEQQRQLRAEQQRELL